MYSGMELIEFYGNVVSEFRKRGMIRSKNVVGDLGEFVAIEFYNNTKGLPKLKAADISTKNVDAFSNKGDRYSIKSTTTTTSGTFFGIEKNVKADEVRPFFEYVILVKFDDMYQLELILEVDWDTFMKHKRWNSRMNAYHLMLTKNLIRDAKIIFQKIS